MRRAVLDQVPNVLTGARVLLAPVVTVLILTSPDGWEAAIAVFALAAASDALDGRIARARNCVSTFGTLVDPVADKILIGSALVALATVGRVGPAVAVVVIAREVAVTLLRMRAVRQGLLIPASRFGKVKMVAQVALVVALMGAGSTASWVQVLLYATVALTVASAIDYFAAYRKAVVAPDVMLAPGRANG